jgi:RHS repeat-associated protein
VNDVTTSTQTDPAVAVDGSNNVYVIWEDWRVSNGDEDIYFAKRSASSGTWSPSVRVNDDGAGNRQGSPDIAVTPGGAAVAVWYDPRGGASKKNIYGARLAAGASTWSANVRVTSNQTAIKGEPKVVFGSTGIAYATWTDRRNGNSDAFFASLASGSSAWSANVKVSDDPGAATQEHPGIGVDGAGNLTVIWRDARTSPANVRASRRLAGSSTWGASVIVGGASAEDTSLSVRSDGLAFVAWLEGAFGGPWAISGSEYDPATGSWSSPELLAQDPGFFPLALAVAVDASQKLLLFDAPGTNGTTEIYWRSRPFSGGGTDSFAYGYDRLDRLTSVTGPDGNTTYAYDPVGNRTSKVLAGTTTYTYDRADRITAAGATSITLDANGNTTAKGADTFTFDQANQLRSATVSGSTESYVYDGDGTRFSRQVGGNPAVRYVSDIAVGLPVTIADGTRKYVYGLGLAFAVSGASQEVYHTDGLGSVRALTDGSGGVTAGFRTDAWGVPTVTTGGSAQPFRFTGEPQDATGLTYLRARYYDPDLGRFTSRDTWMGSPSSPQTQNRYAYANNNPTTNTDPSGHVVDTFVDVAFIVFDVTSLTFGPEKDRESNWLALMADIGTAFIPFVVGGGIVVRSAKISNKIHHLFFSEWALAHHNFAELLEHFGSPDAALEAIQQAAQAAVRQQGKTAGRFEKTVDVGGFLVWVRGEVIDGIFDLGSAARVLP